MTPRIESRGREGKREGRNDTTYREQRERGKEREGMTPRIESRGREGKREGRNDTTYREQRERGKERGKE